MTTHSFFFFFSPFPMSLIAAKSRAAEARVLVPVFRWKRSLPLGERL